MDTVKKKAEKATLVGRNLVKVLIPYGDDYIKQFVTEFENDREIAFRLGVHRVHDPEGRWIDSNPHLLAVCNNLILGSLYSAMYISQNHLSERLNTKILRYLEIEFFNILDQMENVPSEQERMVKG